VQGCLVLARITAFSMMIPSRPIRMAPPASPTRRAPCRIRTPGPIVTSPHSVASGATHAVGSIVGRLPACSINIVSLSLASPHPSSVARVPIGPSYIGRSVTSHHSGTSGRRCRRFPADPTFNRAEQRFGVGALLALALRSCRLHVTSPELRGLTESADEAHDLSPSQAAHHLPRNASMIAAEKAAE